MEAARGAALGGGGDWGGAGLEEELQHGRLGPCSFSSLPTDRTPAADDDWTRQVHLLPYPLSLSCCALAARQCRLDGVRWLHLGMWRWRVWACERRHWACSAGGNLGVVPRGCRLQSAWLHLQLVCGCRANLLFSRLYLDRLGTFFLGSTPYIDRLGTFFFLVAHGKACICEISVSKARKLQMLCRKEPETK